MPGGLKSQASRYGIFPARMAARHHRVDALVAAVTEGQDARRAEKAMTRRATRARGRRCGRSRRRPRMRSSAGLRRRATRRVFSASRLRADTAHSWRLQLESTRRRDDGRPSVTEADRHVAARLVACPSVDIAVVVNPKARRGGANVARACRERLPDARVLVSRSLDDARRLRAATLREHPPRSSLSAGGDGTAVAPPQRHAACRAPTARRRRSAPSRARLPPARHRQRLGARDRRPAWRAAVRASSSSTTAGGPLPFVASISSRPSAPSPTSPARVGTPRSSRTSTRQKTGFGLLPRRLRNGPRAAI